METLSAFDAIHPNTLTTLIVISASIIFLSMGIYVKKVASLYSIQNVASKRSNSKTPEKPNPAEFLFPMFVIAMLWVFAWFLCALSVKNIVGNYENAKSLQANAAIVGKPLHPAITDLVEAWPDIVRSQKENANIDDFDPIMKAYDSLPNYVISTPDQYVKIRGYIKKCFSPNADLGGLDELLTEYPVGDKSFTEAWTHAALRNDYSSDPKCWPSFVFTMIGISYTLM